MKKDPGEKTHTLTKEIGNVLKTREKRLSEKKKQRAEGQKRRRAEKEILRGGKTEKKKEKVWTEMINY